MLECELKDWGEVLILDFEVAVNDKMSEATPLIGVLKSSYT